GDADDCEHDVKGERDAHLRARGEEIGHAGKIGWGGAGGAGGWGRLIADGTTSSNLPNLHNLHNLHQPASSVSPTDRESLRCSRIPRSCLAAAVSPNPAPRLPRGRPRAAARPVTAGTCCRASR